MTSAERYSGVDRLLHRLAFSGFPLQLALADMEDRFFAADLAEGPPERPILIAGLPRAGTTHLLNVLAASEELATNSYRDMPFVLAPLLWDRFSRPFRKTNALRERPHGDGMAVGYDSPEAFEETVWLTFWPDKYGEDHIARWTAEDRDPEFEVFFARQMRKVIALRTRGEQDGAPRRYLSKNNSNIARLELLPALFPDCRILIPFRDPLSHSQSLYRQHRRFQEIHAEDPFARRYMAALGHFEFGADLKPIAFDSLSGSPDDPLFWLSYWVSVHRAFAALDSETIVFIDYADLCRDPLRTVERLADSVGVDCSAAMRSEVERAHAPSQYDLPGDPAFEALLPSAQALYEDLKRKACTLSPIQ
ncbi:sulfotransferase [Algihabitans albus]|uniref:sulfotransferase n=1 Tax=Algihabitans albus TaxID=2164067 RepID=UPI000E5D1C25|nr:sulfotransferase [Algihabitans albus]